MAERSKRQIINEYTGAGPPQEDMSRSARNTMANEEVSFKPVSGNVMPRFSGIATSRRSKQLRGEAAAWQC